MRVAALISQPMRASHCAAYLNTEGSRHTVLTGDPAAFAAYEFAGGIRVVKVTPPPELLPTAKLVRSRWFQQALARARAGSGFGRWLERSVKRLVWRLRYFDRLTILMRRKESRVVADGTVRDSSMYQQLAEEHESQPIDRIVVFDVFDLPVGLRFAEDNELDILVR